MGARLLNNRLSVRVEGFETTTAVITNLKVAGFDHKGKYASFHVFVADEILARKVLGAAMAALGEVFETPYADISVISTKGS